MNAAPPVTFALDADGVGWITFDDPVARANVFDDATQAAFAATLDAATSAKAVVIISAKEKIFIAGADLKRLVALGDAASATEFARAGQSLFQRVAEFPAPVVCAIHGACAGGGFELALACHWRIASDAPATQIGLPETGLGTIPGWGGCVRLPRLIGAKAALDHIVKARLLPAREAARDRLVDEMVPAAALRTRAKAAALNLISARERSRSTPPVAGPDFFSTLRQQVLTRTAGRHPAPLAAIKVVEQSLSLALASALEIEAHAFGAVTAGEVCKNLLHVYFLREAAKKRTLAGWFPAAPVSPAPIWRIGIVGAGVMGSGIAHWLAASGRDVVLRDVREDLITRGMEVVRGLFDDAVKRGQLSPAAAAAGLARITSTTGWDGFATCDLVIEAIVENAAAKQKLFSELAAIVRPDTLLASNTSALPIEEIAGHVPNPARTLGLHFFNPVSRMPLVELIVGRHTGASTADRTLTLVKSLSKTPIICRSSPGFLVTRVLFFYLNEAVRLWDNGVATETLDAALREFGWPMGPLRLIDEVGVDVTDFIFSEMAHYFPERFVRSTACARLLAAGLSGRKNGAGAGFYRYAPPAEATPNNAATALAHADSARAPAPDELSRHLMDVMIGEARRCLEEGVVQSPDDIDFALLSGAGFPAYRGGLMRYTQHAPSFAHIAPR